MAYSRHIPPKVTLETVNVKLDSIYATLLRLINLLNVQVTQGVRIMATLADVEAAVSAETTVTQSVVTLLGSLSQQLQDAVASNDPAQIQAVIDHINANAVALSDAVAANTPAAPVTPADPPAP